MRGRDVPVVLDSGTFRGEPIKLVLTRQRPAVRHAELALSIEVAGSARSWVQGSVLIPSGQLSADEGVTMALGPLGGVVWGVVGEGVAKAELRTVEGETYPAKLVTIPDELGAPGFQAVWGFLDNPTGDRVTTLLYDVDGGVINHMYPVGPRRLLTEGEGPEGSWRLYLDGFEVGAGLTLETVGGGGGACCLDPLDGADIRLVFQQWSGDEDGLSFVVVLASLAVSRIEVIGSAGDPLEGTIVMLPEEVVGPAHVGVLHGSTRLLRSGHLIARDADGVELGRAEVGDSYSGPSGRRRRHRWHGSA